MKTNTYIFHINDPGDPSVGINPSYSKVTIETPLELDDDILEDYKPLVGEMFDVRVKNVMTDQQFEAEQKAMRDWKKEMDNAEEEFRNEIKSMNE